MPIFRQGPVTDGRVVAKNAADLMETDRSRYEMIQALKSHDEASRLETLRQYGVLDTLPEQALDDLTAMAAQICGTPIALISLVDQDRQWFKSRVGLEVAETPREQSFCAHAISQRDLFVVADASKDPRFSGNALVNGAHATRFYAGAPLVTPEDAALGTLCVIDHVPRKLTPEQEQALQILARQVMTHLELRRQMTAVRLSEERFSSAFEHAPIGMALVSLEGRWLKVNQALCDFVGYMPGELAEKSFQDLTHPEDLEADLTHVRELLEGKINSYHMEKRYFHKRGHIVWVNLGVSLARNRENEPLYFISQIQDITESRETLARQQELTQKAQAAERAKSEFLATMSHEIRTPLNGVIGMANILADTELNEMQRECVETINISGESLLSVINDILDYSKIEAGRLEMENRTFNLQQCVEEAVDLFATQIRAKKLEAIYFVSPAIPALLNGDSMRLRQVLVNLIGNAIKFTARGEISVNVELTTQDEKGCHLLFSVSDSGIGIPKEKIDKLFQAFQQVDTSTTRRYGGSGLGLAICKRLTSFMGGSIWAKSHAGAGSTFYFSAILEPSLVHEDHQVDASTDFLRNRAALVVDDNATNRRVLELKLRQWGMEVDSAASGAEATKLAGARKFDVGLIDLQMPGMDGIDLARHIRSQAQTPLILLSSAGEALGAEDAKLFRFQIPKPIKHSSLYNALLKVTGAGGESFHRACEKKMDSGLGQRHPLRILLAEDNAINQKVGLLMLSRLGYTAEAASNGKLALEALEKAPYDVILMDIQMPEMNGIEAANRVRDQYGNDAPVLVALTAEALEGDEERFLALGFNYYLSKPLQADPLQVILKAIKPRVTA
jgi:PAS domain S-box-containing protein